MTEDELIKHVRDNYGPGDVFDGPDLEDWADANNYVYEGDLDEQYRQAGWFHPDYLFGSEVEELAQRLGGIFLPDEQLTNHHDDEHHAGAQAYCLQGACGLVNNY